MNSPIPDYLWLREYEDRLEYRPDHRGSGPLAATPPTFLAIR
jgi:hypothetical protein